MFVGLPSPDCWPALLSLHTYLPAAALTDCVCLTQFPPLCSLCSFPFCFPFVWVLLRVVLRGLTSLGSQQSFKEIKRPYFARMHITPGESCHPGFPLLCYAGMLSIFQAWPWAPDHHEVTAKEWGVPVCVRTSHGDCEKSFMAVIEGDPSWADSTFQGSPRCQCPCIS